MALLVASASAECMVGIKTTKYTTDDCSDEGTSVEMAQEEIDASGKCYGANGRFVKITCDTKAYTTA